MRLPWIVCVPVIAVLSLLGWGAVFAAVDLLLGPVLR